MATENAALKLQNELLRKKVRDVEEQLKVIWKLLTEQRAQWAVLQRLQHQLRRHVEQGQKQQQRLEPKSQRQGPQLETMIVEELNKSVTADVTTKIIGEQRAALRQQRQSPTLAQMVADIDVPARYEWTRVPTKAELRQARTKKQQQRQQQTATQRR